MADITTRHDIHDLHDTRQDTPQTGRRRSGAGMRRTGYLIGAACDAVLLYLINVRPGWNALPFLTDSTPQALGWVNLSLAAGLAAYLVYVVLDPAWLRALGDTITGGISLVSLVRIWQVFPFAFSTAFDWATVVRVLLVLGVVGTGISVLVALGRFLIASAES